MSRERSLPQSRLGRLARLSALGLRTGVSSLLGRDAIGAKQAAEALGTLRGLAAKVGQMASYVDGLVPEGQRQAYEDALRVLQAQAPRSSFADVKRTLETELSSPLEQLFASFEPEPIASASIGQVHRAVLHDGTEVAVKVQHPGVERAIEADLKNAGMIEGMAAVLGGQKLDIKGVLDVIRTRFREELDYGLEAERMQSFAALHAGDPRVVVPTVYPERSTRRVLTTSFVAGLPFEEACNASDAERRAWAETLWRFVFKAILFGGLLNVDPHPGNYLFLPEGRVAFLDFGCVQELDLSRQAAAQAAHRAVLAGDDHAFAQAAKRMTDARPGILEAPSVAYVRRCFEPLLSSPYRMQKAYAGALVTEMKDLAQLALTAPKDELFTMPPDIVFVNRLQFGFYSVLARLDVEADYASVERQFIAEADAENARKSA